MRMDPKTRFVIEFLARMRGQSISTVVERAIQETADKLTIGDGDDFSVPKTWKNFWHVSEGIRTLMVASDKGLYPTFDEEYLLAFAKTHWPFFYTTSKCENYKEWSIEILWPRITEFIDIWTKTKASDYFAAGKAMRAALSAAGVAPPKWPIETESRTPNHSSTSERKAPIQDLDDEIPF